MVESGRRMHNGVESIHAFIADAGPQGATAAEIAAALPYDAEQVAHTIAFLRRTHRIMYLNAGDAWYYNSWCN
jgi:hypothetical protein